jgi:hypothetical protein
MLLQDLCPCRHHPRPPEKPSGLGTTQAHLFQASLDHQIPTASRLCHFLHWSTVLSIRRYLHKGSHFPGGFTSSPVSSLAVDHLEPKTCYTARRLR